MAAQDSRQRPLRPEHTCAHLEVGSSSQAGRFYARCGLGSAAERQRWAAAHGGGPEDARGLSADIRGTPQRRIRAPR